MAEEEADLPAAAAEEAAPEGNGPAPAPEDAVPAEEVAPDDVAPAEYAAPEDAAPAESEAPEDASPTEEEPPAVEASRPEEPPPADVAAPAEEAAPPEEAPPADEAAPAEQAAPADEAPPAEAASPAEEAPPVEAAPPAEAAPPVEAAPAGEAPPPPGHIPTLDLKPGPEAKVLSTLANGFYDREALKRQPTDSELDVDLCTLVHGFGMDTKKRNNIHYVGPGILLFAVGNIAELLDLETMSQSYLPGLDGGGIGAVCVHPTRKFFVVAEKGTNPNVYVYEFPSLNLYRILRGGTERGYSAARFNREGTKLATVGMYPDFMLTVWNWEQEAIILRCKAFAQDIFDVSFSEFFEGKLTTCGQGHIRFWKMASTFTGLKLQGDIGKFGNEELSDIAGYVELPDGKVLSGTESGKLLLWDGGLIKVVLMKPGGKNCHDAMIETITLDLDNKKIVTSGLDGFVKAWDFTVVMNAEPDEDIPTTTIIPLEEVLIGTDVQIKGILFEENHYMIQDEAGFLKRVGYPGYATKNLVAHHAGPIAALGTSARAHFAVTVGHDGTVRLWDYVATRLVYTRKFNSGGTCLCMVPYGLDPEGRQFAVGFADGVVRVLARCADEWKLYGAFKPHKGAVTVIAYAPDHSMLATASDDETMFFFDMTDEEKPYKPIGYLHVPNKVTALCWSADSSMLLVGCKDGQIFEVDTPDPQFNSNKSYHMTNEQRPFHFTRPKPPKPEKPKKEDGEDAEEGEFGDDPDGLPPLGDENEESEEEEEEEGVGYEVKTIAYHSDQVSKPGHFVVTLGGKAAGFLYECKLSDPEFVKLSLTHVAAVGFRDVSHSRKFLLSGADDGTVRIQPVRPIGPNGMAPEQELYEGFKTMMQPALPKYWHQPLHDGNCCVTGVALSFDDHYLLSTATDGSFFVHQVSLPADVSAGEQDGDLTPVPKVALDPIEECIDITLKDWYSIEEAKQKTEEDHLIQLAEEKKMGMRRYLQTIRDEFQELMQANERRPQTEQLPREEFEIDPQLRKLIENETAEKLEVARLELQWESEKRVLALDKLRSWFLDSVEVERIVLRPFKFKFKVTTFRTLRLPVSLLEEIEEIHRVVAMEDRNKATAKAGEGRMNMTTSQQINMNNDSGGRTVQALGATNDQAVDEKTLSKADLRRMQRKKREEEWAVFNKTKPDANYENPDDVAAIQEAINNMGDFKLKTDPSYIVPEEQRQNAMKKRRQMVLLEQSIYNIKMDFNTRFLALRDVKNQMSKDIQRSNERIRHINDKLDIQEDVFKLETLADECPEMRDQVTEDDLKSFEAELSTREAETKVKGRGGFGSGDKKKEEEAKKAEEERKKVAAAAAKGGGVGAPGSKKEDSKISLVSDAAPEIEDSRMAALQTVPLSALEELEKKMLHKQLEYEKSKLVKRQGEAIKTFDEAVSDLRREKFRLEADLKSADMKRLVLYQEFILLRESETQDLSLKTRLDGKMAERTDILSKISETRDKLETKKEEVDKLVEKKQQIFGEFDTLVEESNTFREVLLKIFTRKIKRLKKKVKDNDDEDYDSEEEETDDDDDEDFDDEEEEEVCPPGCDQGLYEKVCDLREKRLDQEDIITEFQKSIDAFNKERETYSKKQKTIEMSLKKIDEEIAEFQKEKQNKLNAIDVVITLKMHQMEYLVDGQLPDDISMGLVFSNASLRRLKMRIKELIAEKAQLKRKQKELRREHIQLHRDKKAKEQRIAELEGRAYDVQMLKFGQLIDLSILDRMGSNKGAEDLKEALKKQEVQHQLEIDEWNQKIEQAQLELTEVTKHNTACLAAVADLTHTQKQLEGVLNNTQGTLFNDPMAQRRKEIQERDRLVQVVNKQAKNIESLKQEIQVLRMKGGQVYG